MTFHDDDLGKALAAHQRREMFNQAALDKRPIYVRGPLLRPSPSVVAALGKELVAERRQDDAIRKLAAMPLQKPAVRVSGLPAAPVTTTTMPPPQVPVQPASFFAAMSSSVRAHPALWSAGLLALISGLVVVAKRRT